MVLSLPVSDIICRKMNGKTCMRYGREEAVFWWNCLVIMHRRKTELHFTWKEMEILGLALLNLKISVLMDYILKMMAPKKMIRRIHILMGRQEFT